MADQQHIFDQVDAYLKGELSNSELAVFKSTLKENRSLQQEVAKAKIIHQLAIQHRLLHVKSLADAEYQRTHNQNNHIGKFLLGILGVGIVASSLIFFHQKETVTPSVNSEKKSPASSNESMVKEEVLVNSISKQEESNPINTTTKTPIVPLSTVEQRSEESDKSNVDDKSFVKPITNSHENTPQTTVSEENSSIKSPCEGILLHTTINTHEGCVGKDNSSISVGTISGGDAPYHIQVMNQSHEKTAMFDLPDGNYTITVSDANKCETKYKAVIKSKNCPLNIDFNPNYGETWELPITNTRGELKIFTKTGLTIISKQIQANEQFNWDGKTEQGEIVQGYFIFTLNYEDGSRLNGSVTVTQ